MKIKDINESVKQNLGAALKYNLQLLITIIQIDSNGEHTPIPFANLEATYSNVIDGIKQLVIGKLDPILNYISLTNHNEGRELDKKQEETIKNELLKCFEQNDINFSVGGILGRFKKKIRFFQESFLNNETFTFLTRNFKIDYEVIINPVGSVIEVEKPKELKAPKEVKLLKAASYSEGDFYKIPKEYIISNTLEEYRKFLREAGYMDLDSCDGLLVEKNISNTGMNWFDGKKLVENEGYKLLTVGLMYLVFIPFIKELAAKKNKDAKATLKEMINDKAEWMNDLILNKNTLKIDNKEIELDLPQKDESFDRSDLNKFGYPIKVKSSGEFYYWYPRSNEIAAFRSWGAGLSLYLKWVPALVLGVLGVRRAKIFFKNVGTESTG